MCQVVTGNINMILVLFLCFTASVLTTQVTQLGQKIVKLSDHAVSVLL